MFVRLSARSRTHRPCEDTRIGKVLPFLLDLRRRKSRRISRTASPARKAPHTQETEERRREKETVVGRKVRRRPRLLRSFTNWFSSQQESMMNEKRHETKRNTEGMKNGCQRWMQNACNEWMYWQLMDERDFSSSVCDLTTSSSFSRLGLQWYVQSRYAWWMKKDMTEGWCKMDEKRMDANGGCRMLAFEEE